MKIKLRVIANTIILLLSICIVFCAAFYFFFLRQVVMVRTIQILHSPDSMYKAKLVRIDSIDINFYVKVNGERVYWSPDFAPNPKVDFHERLVWDSSGQIVVLEVTRRRLFGYDTKNKRNLSDEELLEVEYAPEPNKWEYGFEGTWPEERIKTKKTANRHSEIPFLNSRAVDRR